MVRDSNSLQLAAPFAPLKPQTLRDVERERAAAAAAYSAPLQRDSERVLRDVEREQAAAAAYSVTADTRAHQLREQQEWSNAGYSMLCGSRAQALQFRAAPARGQGGSSSSLLSASDDLTLTKRIEGFHNSDARHVDVKPLFHLAKEVIESANQIVEGRAQGMDRSEVRATLHSLEEVPNLPLIIERLQCQITTGPIGDIAGQETAFYVLKTLSEFSWEAKAVLTMAAFALTYGDFWLLVQIYATNPLAKSMALIKGLPMVVEHAGTYKQQFEAIQNLVKCMLETTRCIVDFWELPPSHISTEDPDIKAAFDLFPTAVYRIIRSAVAAAQQISNLTSTRHEYMNARVEAMELSSYSVRLQNTSDHLSSLLKKIQERIEEKKERQIYDGLEHTFDGSRKLVDNIAALRVIIREDDSVPPLYDCHTKKRVALDVLRRKTVLLLISSLDITGEELSILEHAYGESKIHEYEILWIPVMDQNAQWTDAMRAKFEALQQSMPWYTVYDPKIIRKEVMKFFREKWHFKGRPILVVLDNQGKVLNLNVIHMMWIWQREAFPFTTEREEKLWQMSTWNLDLLVDEIGGEQIPQWIREEKHIILYGGDNMKWIRDFTTKMKKIADDLQIPLEMVYVGKSHQHKGVVSKNNSTIAMEKLSYFWDENLVWYFWTRVESMFHSKMQVGATRNHSDITLQELQRLLSFDKGPEGWVILAKGSNIAVNAHGRLALNVVADYSYQLVEKAKIEGLEKTFVDIYNDLYKKEPICLRIDFPLTARIPDYLLCPDCRQDAQQFYTFICCHENSV